MPNADPRAAASAARDLTALDTAIAACDACPRLVAWREDQARVKVARFRDETYWAHAVPGFGDATARILLVGLAPAAHGANRTGRVFTGDASGDFLWRAMHEVGLLEDESLRLPLVANMRPRHAHPPGRGAARNLARQRLRARVSPARLRRIYPDSTHSERGTCPYRLSAIIAAR